MYSNFLKYSYCIHIGLTFEI